MSATSHGAIPAVATRLPWPPTLPPDWRIKRLKHITSMRSGEAITSEAMDDDAPFPVFGGNGVRGHTDGWTHDGDYVLVGRQGAQCGNVHRSAGRFWASEHAVVVTPLGHTSTAWLEHLLRAMRLGQYSMAAAQPGLAVDHVLNLHVPVPPATLQIAIADFLDRECERIAALHARRDAQWAALGHIPASAREAAATELPLRVAIGLKARTIAGAGFPHDDQGADAGELPFVKASDLQRSPDGRMVHAAANWVSRSTAARLRAGVVPVGATLLPKIGAAMLKNTRRQAAVPLVIDNNLTAVVSRDPDEADAIYELLCRVDLGGVANPGPVPSFSEGALRSLRIPWGTREQLQSLVRAVREATANIEPLRAALRASGRLLSEYRDALITEAVTGQLDVSKVSEAQMDERAHAALEGAAP